MSAEEHRDKAGDAPLQVAVVTVSSTRTQAEDASGDLIVAVCTDARHRVVSRRIVVV